MGATGDYDNTGAPSRAPMSEPETNSAGPGSDSQDSGAGSDSPESDSPESDSPGGHSPRPDHQDAT